MWLNAAVEGVGKRALAFARYAGGIAYLTGDTLVSLLSPRHQTRWREITHQMVRFTKRHTLAYQVISQFRRQHCAIH